MTDKDTSTLEEYEVDIIDYLKSFKGSDNNISLAGIADKETYDHYSEFKNNWLKKAQDSISDSMIKRYFDDKGTKIFNKALFILFIISIIITIFAIMLIGILPMLENYRY